MRTDVSASNEVDTTTLRNALEEALSHHLGVRRSIAELRRCRSPYSSSFAIEELQVGLEDGSFLQLVWKDLGSRALLKAARVAKPSFLYDPLREIETYRSILAQYDLGTATFYGAVVEARAERYWLFLEKVRGVELYQVGDLEVWRAAARWLAEMHTDLGALVESLAQDDHVLRHDGEFYRVWLRRAREHGRYAGPASARAGLEWLAERYERVVERLMALPLTFIHGELYASNVLVQHAPEGQTRVCPVDWEMAAIGPGLIDLAALVAGSWSEEERATLALAYRDGLANSGGAAPSVDQLRAELDLCRLHLAVQWLGWAADWQPPSAHAHDWLSEALQLAEGLEL